MRRAWLLLSFGDERQYAGNPGYLDEPRRLYRYDSFVPNHKQVQEGDYVFIRDKHRLQGMAYIEAITETSGEKLRLRCPECGTTGLKARESKSPRYRCNHKHEFETPKEELASCQLYSAEYGSTFLATPEALSLQELKDACPRLSDQLAIQEIYWEPLAPRLTGKFPDVQGLFGLSAIETPVEKEFTPTTEDTRKRAQRLVHLRQGQKEFRNGLLQRYGTRCMVSGCELFNVLEAAHIDPYRGKESNHLENGLILRADLHTLFDLDLLGIEPETLSVKLHPDACRSGYESFDNRPLLVTDLRPGAQALKVRWLLFQNRLSDDG